MKLKHVATRLGLALGAASQWTNGQEVLPRPEMRRLTPGCGTRQVSLAVLCGAAARGQYRALQKQLPCLPRKAARLGNRCCRCRLDAEFRKRVRAQLAYAGCSQ